MGVCGSEQREGWRAGKTAFSPDTCIYPTAFGAPLRSMNETFGSPGGIAETQGARFVVFETATYVALGGTTGFLFRPRLNWHSTARRISGFLGMRDSANGGPEVRQCTSIESWPSAAT